MTAMTDGWVATLALTISINKRDDEDGCSYWQAPLSKEGYPLVRVLGNQYPAHRAVAAIWYGPGAVVGKDVHHLCAHKSCVNPEHLVPVTPEEHARAHQTCTAPTPPARCAESISCDDVIEAIRRGGTKSKGRSRRAA